MRTTYLLRLKTDLKEKLEEIAEEQGISLNALLQIELRKFIEKWEKENN